MIDNIQINIGNLDKILIIKGIIMPRFQRLNDNMLATIYFRLQAYYKNLIPLNSIVTGPHQANLYAKLQQFIVDELFSEQGSLNSLDEQEHFKVYNILDTFFEAAIRNPLYKEDPLYKEIKKAQRTKNPSVTKIVYDRSIYIDNSFHSHRSPFYYWDRLFRSTHIDSTSHHHPRNDSTSESPSAEEVAAKAKMGLLLVGVGLLTTSLGVLSSWYLMAQILDSVERLSYNEGTFKAAATLLTIVLSTTAATVLAAAVAAEPLATLAIGAGLVNPVGIVAFGVLSIGVTLAAITTYFTNKLLLNHIYKSNPDALDPRDPKRFSLSQTEYNHLRKEGIDPIKVKCAIAAIRKEMGREPVAAPLTPNFLFFHGRTKAQADHLETIRTLKQGKKETVDVGDLHFNLALDEKMEKFYKAESQARKQEPAISQETAITYAPSCP